MQTGPENSKNLEHRRFYRVRNGQRFSNKLRDSKLRTVYKLLSQNGVLPKLSKRKLELKEVIANFLLTEKRLLIVGGEPGMGKSLLVTDLSILHRAFNKLLPKNERTNLSVVSWDMSHQMFFEMASKKVGMVLELPEGETNIKIRKLISSVIADTVLYALRNLDNQTKIIVETPLVGFRGENIFEEINNFRKLLQVVIMHSPKTRIELMKKGRLNKTSGQPKAMRSIRSWVLTEALGPDHEVSPRLFNNVVKSWWLAKLSNLNGVFVEWDPNENREWYQKSINEYKRQNIRSDIILPTPISLYARRQFKSVLETLPNLEKLLADNIHK